jgi:hypothetical protein
MRCKCPFKKIGSHGLLADLAFELRDAPVGPALLAVAREHVARPVATAQAACESVRAGGALESDAHCRSDGGGSEVIGILAQFAVRTAAAARESRLGRPPPSS